MKKRKPWKQSKPLSPQRYIDTTRMKVAHIHEGAGEKYKPKFPKPGKSIKIDDPNSTTWKRKAISKWYEYMHLFKRYCLINENCEGELEAHHLIRKANELTRNDPLNGVMVCSKHHRLDPKLSAHKGPKGFAKFLNDNYPDKSEYIIANQYNTGKPNFKSDYEHLVELIEGL